VDMDGSFEHLESLLSEEKGLFESLLACLNKQKQALVGNDVERIGEVVESTKRAVWELRKVHSERQAAAARLSPSGESDLGSILQLAPRERSERMRTLVDEMRALVDGVRKANSSNMALAASGLEYLGKCVEILLGGEDELGVYGNGNDQARSATQPRLLDQSA